MYLIHFQILLHTFGSSYLEGIRIVWSNNQSEGRICQMPRPYGDIISLRYFYYSFHSLSISILGYWFKDLNFGFPADLDDLKKKTLLFFYVLLYSWGVLNRPPLCRDISLWQCNGNYPSMVIYTLIYTINGSPPLYSILSWGLSISLHYAERHEPLRQPMKSLEIWHWFISSDL